ncbi:MAG TPA: MraY family glycosyltransferase [Roseimicrobium sp.]|nr:MraY family glycosyltransferase [Roseimicrobium sp.]
MTFPFNLYVLGFALAFIGALGSLPLWRKWCIKVDHVDDPGHRKIHHTPVPLAGGLAVFTGMLLALAGLAIAMKSGWMGTATQAPLSHGAEQRIGQMVAILLGAAGMLVLGWFDDRHELKAGPKFAGQMAIALLVAASGVRITLFVPSLLFSYAITVLWILTIVNAMNFMDNMNGLCSGLGAIGTWWFGLSAAVSGQYLVALLAFLTCGALLGFLPHNFPNASAFLGDAGSHLTGYLLAVLAILPHFYTPGKPHHLVVLTPLLILAVPLGDMAWVVALRTRMGKPFWIGDTNHLSHRLVRRGLSKPHAVLVIWLMAAVAGALAML